MKEEVHTKIPLNAYKQYPKDWHDTQEQQDAYDDLNRKKQNFQKIDYIEENELICFGLSEHQTEENLPAWSEKAQKDLSILNSWIDKANFENFLTRPAYKSDYNYTNYATRAQLRVLLGLLVIRELPIKSFYARCWVAYFWCTYFVLRGNGRGLTKRRPIVTMNQQHNYKALLNYPDLFYWNLTKILSHGEPRPNIHREWRMWQNPVFHQTHRNVYRYRYREPRYIPWDGTMSQPVMPYLSDMGNDVINGTFKRNAASTPTLR